MSYEEKTDAGVPALHQHILWLEYTHQRIRVISNNMQQKDRVVVQPKGNTFHTKSRRRSRVTAAGARCFLLRLWEGSSEPVSTSGIHLAPNGGLFVQSKDQVGVTDRQTICTGGSSYISALPRGRLIVSRQFHI